jgi:hypothetical protein
LAIGGGMIRRIEKRDGRIVKFEPEKIAKQSLESIPCAEDVLDIVERALIDEEYSKEDKA